MTNRRRAARVLTFSACVLLAAACTPVERLLWCDVFDSRYPAICEVVRSTSTTTTAPASTTTAPPVASGGGGGATAAPAPTTTAVPAPETVDRFEIIAIGDSQTSDDRPFRPAWPNLLEGIGGDELAVENAAIGGTLLAAATTPHNTASMQETLDTALSRNPDVVVIIGGTNDMRWGVVTVQQFTDAVADMANRVRASGARLVISTIPPLGRQSEHLHRSPDREAVNEWMRATFDEATLIDLDAHLAVDGLLPDDQQTVEQDGVHIGSAAEAWIASQVWHLLGH